jgi:hypothetical protein
MAITPVAPSVARYRQGKLLLAILVDPKLESKISTWSSQDATAAM